ncbi:hypothetical protein WNY37_07100 [Henriciella sp. AS95]|uniref:hypothetical protein n=1 Tax=Henriciella sp. AS95 TaxID=3135782 RepID=UPI003171C1F8
MLSRIVIAACLFAMSASQVMAQTAEVKMVEGDLPGESRFEAPAGLEALTDRDVVLLDLSMLPLAWPGVLQEDGTYATPQTCDFGMLDGVERISVPTGSNHLLMDVHIGDTVHHPANGLSCEYSPVLGGPQQDWARMRLSGCFIVRDVSIPTARQLVLNPLPGSACGLYE